MYKYFWHYSFLGRLACWKVYKLMFLVLCVLFLSHLISEKLNQCKIANHLSAHTASCAWLYNSRISVLPWKYSHWRMFIAVKVLWLWLCSGWLSPAHHLCLLCKCFQSQACQIGLSSLLIARPETFIQQVSWCS